jgi:hypothetical protein
MALGRVTTMEPPTLRVFVNEPLIYHQYIIKLY